MKHPNSPFAKLLSQGLLTAVVGIVGAAVLATLPVPAVSATLSPQAQYARDVAHCRSLTPHSTERANCLSEASTRYHGKLPSKASESPEILAANALRRCERLPGDHKTECIARMQHGTATGTVAGGGVLRSLTTREVVTDPAALPPTAAGTAAPSVGDVPAVPPVTYTPPPAVGASAVARPPQPPMPPQPPAAVPPAPAPMVPTPAPVPAPQPVPPHPQPVPPMQPGQPQ